MEEKDRYGLMHGCIAALLFAVMGLIVKLIDAPVSTIIFARFCIGFFLVLPWLRSIRKEHLLQGAVRNVAGVLFVNCFFYSLSYLPVINALTFVNTVPLFVPLVVLIWLKLVISKQRILGIGIGFIGILCVLRPSTSELFTQVGTLFGLLTGVFGAITTVALRRMTREHTVSILLMNYFFWGTLLNAVPMVITWKPIVDPWSWVFLGCIGIAGTFAQYFTTQSVVHTSASKSSLTRYVSVIFGGLLGWLFLGEAPTWWDLCGISLIVMGGIIAFFDHTTPRKLA